MAPKLTAVETAHWLEGAPMDPAAEPPEPLPALEGFPYVYRGSCALVSGPTGHGRSSLVQAGAYDAACAGHRVAYLGSEVTEPEFNARARDLANRRGDTINKGLAFLLARVRYLDLAGVIACAWEHPDEWTAEMAARFDIALIDPLSAVASVLDLDFDTSNAEFVRFYEQLLQPLATANLAVVMLDNIGHALEARSRAKGASAKQDKPDITLSCKLKAQPVGLIVAVHKVRGIRAPFRKGDSWVFDRDTQRIESSAPHEDRDEGGFRPTYLMERVSRAIEESPGLTRRALRTAVTGKHDAKELALDRLITEGYVEKRRDGKWETHHSTTPFRDDNDALAPTGPQPAPGATGATTGPLAPSLKGQGPGATPTGATPNGEVAPTDEAYVERLIADNLDLAREGL